MGIVIFVTHFLGLYSVPPVASVDFTKRLENATSTKERRDIYLQMGNWHYYEGNPDSALPYYRLALQTSDSISLNDDSHYWILLGLIRSIKDTAQQREYFQSALKILEMTDGAQHSKIIELLEEFASYDISNISDNERLQYLKRALEISRNISSVSQESEALHQLSRFYEKKRKIVLAETLLVQSMRLMDDGPYEQLSKVHTLADFYSRTDRDSLGLSMLYQHEKNIDTVSPFLSVMFRAELYSHIGWIALKQNDTALARNIFLSANNIWIKEKERFYSYFRARNSLDLCYILLKEGQIEAARKEFQQLQSEVEPEILNKLINMTSTMGDHNMFYMSWEGRRQEAHSFVFNTFIQPDGKTEDR
jgi:tetratricopeptide (TPR) repeat protein